MDLGESSGAWLTFGQAKNLCQWVHRSDSVFVEQMNKQHSLSSVAVCGHRYFCRVVLLLWRGRISLFMKDLKETLQIVPCMDQIRLHTRKDFGGIKVNIQCWLFHVNSLYQVGSLGNSHQGALRHAGDLLKKRPVKDKGEWEQKEVGRAAACEQVCCLWRRRGKEGGFGRESQTAVQF